MDSNNSNITTSSDGGNDHFFPTSTHFFDPLGLQQPTFLDDSPTSWPPQQQETNIHPTTTTTTSSCSIGAETTKTTAVDAAPGGPTSSRPSKKRSRASRRAPTTVLTTDTSNFRAMVQEFTGIPAPPAYNPLHFPRSISMFFNPPPPAPSFITNNFQPATSASDPINFQSILQSQLLNFPQPAAPVTVPSSGELSLPGVLIEQQQMAEFRNEKGSEGGRGDGLLESWMCSSD